LEIILSTRNQGKVREIMDFVGDLHLKISTLADIHYSISLEETGNNYQENAINKAQIVANTTGKITLADDSGLEVDALGGKPGVESARFGGEGLTDSQRNQILLEYLGDIPWDQRTARYVCLIAIVKPGQEPFICQGVCTGLITFNGQGDKGFGYDPIFYLPEYSKTMAELDLVLKNRISHRAKALAQAKQILLNLC
jgi:XTP/dITP diphosphohydrolase